jgi:two-component system, OmpR family, response regulator
MPLQYIYIFDEDPAAALITQRGLQAMLGERLMITIAPTANAAWLACARGNVDLLIVDPGVRNGPATSLIRAVRTYRPKVPILVLTAYDTPGMRTRMRNLGVAYYAAKPIELRDLLPSVRAALQPTAAAVSAA